MADGSTTTPAAPAEKADETPKDAAQSQGGGNLAAGGVKEASEAKPPPEVDDFEELLKKKPFTLKSKDGKETRITSRKEGKPVEPKSTPTHLTEPAGRNSGASSDSHSKPGLDTEGKFIPPNGPERATPIASAHLRHQPRRAVNGSGNGSRDRQLRLITCAMPPYSFPTCFVAPVATNSGESRLLPAASK